MNKLVSIVMCTYNGSKYIREQVESILNQSYSNIELIISDDCSTDDTYGILQTYSEQDVRIKLYKNEQNLGYNLNFSLGCTKASGNYIAIADQDDVWENEKISLLVRELESDPKIVLVHALSARFTDKGKKHLKSLKIFRPFRGNDCRQLFLLNRISGHNVLVRSSLMNQSIPFPTGVFYDWWLALNACTKGTVSVVERVLTWHRIHEQNATGAAKRKVPFYLQVQTIVPHFLQIVGMKERDKQFGKKLLRYYLEFPEKKFSISLFLFLLGHAAIVFGHKKRVFPWLSYIKHASRYASSSTQA